MKILLCFLTAALLLATASPTRAATETFFKVAVTGTVQTQIVSEDTGRIRTAILNEKRILQEYGVFSEDYELVLGTTSGLQLVPKRASAMLPTFTILTFGSSSTLVSSKAHFIKLESAILAEPDASTIFDKVAGEVAGTAHFKGTFSATVFDKLSLSVTARGFDPNPGGTGQALLKFKIVTGGVFVQKP